MVMIGDLINDFCNQNSTYKLIEPISIIRQTKIPLIIAKLESGFRIDIQFPHINFQAIRNTNYIRHCIMVFDIYLFKFVLFMRMKGFPNCFYG